MNKPFSGYSVNLTTGQARKWFVDFDGELRWSNNAQIVQRTPFHCKEAQDVATAGFPSKPSHEQQVAYREDEREQLSLRQLIAKQ